MEQFFTLKVSVHRWPTAHLLLVFGLGRTTNMHSYTGQNQLFVMSFFFLTNSSNIKTNKSAMKVKRKCEGSEFPY